MIIQSTAQSIFITGTDTDAGKTYVCALLLKQFIQQGQSAIGYKPIAAGAQKTENGLRNDDALILQQASSGKPSYQTINPICYEPAIAPHIAAAMVGESISIKQLNQWWQQRDQQHEIEIIEGAGGWRLPINDSQWLSEFVIAQKLDVIIVVGMKLGCLNHALLTVEAVKNDGLNVIGWVANQLSEPMPYYQTNLDYLIKNMPAPMLGEVKSHQQLEPGLFDLTHFS